LSIVDNQSKLADVSAIWAKPDSEARLDWRW